MARVVLVVRVGREDGRFGVAADEDQREKSATKRLHGRHAFAAAHVAAFAMQA
jgi:hypothetical protein